jgi:two-component system response regulator HydG
LETNVLVTDDDHTVGLVVEGELRQRGYRVIVCQTPEQALARVERGGVDVVLADFNMAGLSGATLCARIVESGRDVPVIVMTAFGSMESAVESIRAGAYDYVTKPLDMTELALTLDRAAEERALRQEARRLRHATESVGFERMIGSSPTMAHAFELVDRVARSDVTVLVTGESGTGKELVAKAIHARSARAAGPFVAINCAALPESLLESELFGHVRGAFTDAHQAKRGLFLRATGGTLLLDEIGEMPAGMQAKLLRALQERTVRPVGGDTEVPYDARIVASTNVDLDAAVAAKRFREDLFYRINVVRIALPLLRKRGRDVLDIASHVLRSCQPDGLRVVGFKPSAIDALRSYPWPGNVRELQNAIQCGVALSEFDHIGLEDLPESIRDYCRGDGRLRAQEPTEFVTAAELERQYIDQVLNAVGGNKTLAAKVLGFDRRTLYRKLEAYAKATAKPPDPAAAGITRAA